MNNYPGAEYNNCNEVELDNGEKLQEKGVSMKMAMASRQWKALE